MAEDVTATEDEIAAQVLAERQVVETPPVVEEPALTLGQQAYLDKKFSDFENVQVGRFTNWTATRTKEADGALQREMGEIRAERERERNFMLNQMDEDQRRDFLADERDRKIDAMLEKPLPSPEPQAAPAQTGLSPEQEQLGISVQSYAQAKSLTLTPADTWLWAGATAGMSMSQYDTLAKKNIDARAITPPAATPPATSPVATLPGTPPATTSAPKGQSINIESMTLSERADAFIAGDITDQEYRDSMRM